MTSTLEKNELKNYLPDPKSSKIAVAMSGGVDSSVALYLLKKAGYEVIGITAWLIAGGGRCCDDGVIDAVKVCDQLGVKHHTVDLRQEFANGIVRDFHESYQQGETPIPCISCNNDMKWGHLLDYSIRELGATHLASGHHAKIIREADTMQLHKSPDAKKDQSYMLWGLTNEQLSKTVFPIGDYTKDEVREFAEEGNLCVAKKPDSQDICFVSNGMTNSDYLLKILGEKPGDIIEIESGEILGQHKGSFNYTYGQRKGLGVAYSEPLYVVKIDPENNAVYVGTKEKLLEQRALGRDLNMIHIPAGYSKTEFPAQVKIRYNSSPSPAKIFIKDNKQVEVEFAEPVEAITPGQAMAFYDISDANHLLGGAWIDAIMEA